MIALCVILRLEQPTLGAPEPVSPLPPPWGRSQQPGYTTHHTQRHERSRSIFLGASLSSPVEVRQRGRARPVRRDLRQQEHPQSHNRDSRFFPLITRLGYGRQHVWTVSSVYNITRYLR